jgi:hypothetical protein
MPRAKANGGKPPKRPIERYEYSDKKREETAAKVCAGTGFGVRQAASRPCTLNRKTHPQING